MPPINLQTLLQGLTGGLRGFNQANLLRDQREQEGLEQALALAREERAQDVEFRDERRFRASQLERRQELARRTRTGESSLMQAIFKAEEEERGQRQQQESLQRLLGQRGITGPQAQDVVRAGVKPSFGQIFPKPEKPPKPTKTPLERLTPKGRIDLTTEAVNQQRSDALDELQKGLEAKDVSFSKDKFGRASLADLEKQARAFADPEGDRPGVKGPGFDKEQPQDASFLALFNRAQSFLSDTARTRTSQNLPQFFPSLRPQGRSLQDIDAEIAESEARIKRMEEQENRR